MVFSVPLLAVALFCAEACPMGTRIHTSSMAAKSFQRLDDALEDCNVVVLIKIDSVYKLVLIYFSVRRAWRCRGSFYHHRSCLCLLSPCRMVIMGGCGQSSHWRILKISFPPLRLYGVCGAKICLKTTDPGLVSILTAQNYCNFSKLPTFYLLICVVFIPKVSFTPPVLDLYQSLSLVCSPVLEW